MAAGATNTGCGDGVFDHRCCHWRCARSVEGTWASLENGALSWLPTGLGVLKPAAWSNDSIELLCAGVASERAGGSDWLAS